MNNEIEALKALIFEIYAAGYQDSINNIDIVKRLEQVLGKFN